MITLRQFLKEKIDLENHAELNPALWSGDSLRPEVRSKLIDFANQFARFSRVPSALITDILLVGGSAGYNWTKFSDVDVHVVAKRSELGDPMLVDDLLKSKKKLWSLVHHATIRGLPLEGYVQDPSESSPEGQGVFSLKHNAWVKRPKHDEHSWTTDRAFADKVETFEHQIDHLISTHAPLEEFGKLKSRISNMRKVGLSSGGEYSPENLTFKALRNSGYLQKMTDYVQRVQDRDLTLEGRDGRN